ncbi:DMT family transporter [Profundibacter sp.]
MTQNKIYYLALVLMGVVWGLVFPITKIALSTGYKPFGIMVWQMVIGIVLMGAIILFRGKKPVFSARYMLLFIGIAALGTLIPNYFSYTATANLPAGVMSILIALVPLFAMSIALLTGGERPGVLRLLGLGFGAAAVFLLIGPAASLPDPTKYGFVLLGMLAPLAYGLEANFLQWIGDQDIDPFQMLFGACIIGLLISLPIVLGSGGYITPFQPWGVPEWAIVAASVVNQIAYVGYIWLVGRAGAVFASQVGYLVTGAGVVASMLMLGERYSGYIWAALALMMVGLFLVRPRDNARVSGNDGVKQE